MALVVLCGQPSSGKSSCTAQLRVLFEQQGCTVEVVDEISVHLDKSTCYSSALNEKSTRAKLKSGVDRAVHGKTICLLDAINNIKGYRYELWCIARAAAAKYCMVHVDTPVDTCREWNLRRPEGDRYPENVFEDLISRFEIPDSRSRWDSPLFTLRPGGGRHDTEDPSGEDDAAVMRTIVATMTASPAASKQQQQQQLQPQQARALVPTCATTNPALLATNLLHELDRAAQNVIDRIVEAQSASAGGDGGGGGGGGAGGLDVQLGDGLESLRLNRPVALVELRRIKRAYLKLATKITFSRIHDAQAAQRMFIDYLKEQL